MRPLASRDVLGRPLRRAHAMMGGTALVLIYHRVADRPADPQLQCVSASRFEEQMSALASTCTVLSIERLSEHLREHRPLPPHAACITFDDGYADNYAHAVPVLERLGLPATIYVNSGLVDSGRRGWVDEVERLILRARRLPHVVELRAGADTVRLDFGEGASTPGDERWDVTMPPPTMREAAYLDVMRALRPADDDTRAGVIAQLAAVAEGVPDDFESDRVMSSAEIAKLAAQGLVTIGSHTQHHRLLAAASPKQQRTEIAEDKRALEAMTGVPVAHFSYPYGGRDDYTDETAAIVAHTGFRSACANHFGVTTPWTDLLRIPRISPIGIAGERLSDALAQWRSSGK